MAVFIFIVLIIITLSSFLVGNVISMIIVDCRKTLAMYPICIEIYFIVNVIIWSVLFYRFNKQNVDRCSLLNQNLSLTKPNKVSIIFILLDSVPLLLCLMWLYNILTTTAFFSIKKNMVCLSNMIFNIVQLVIFTFISIIGLIHLPLSLLKTTETASIT